MTKNMASDCFWGSGWTKDKSPLRLDWVNLAFKRYTKVTKLASSNILFSLPIVEFFLFRLVKGKITISNFQCGNANRTSKLGN